MKTKTYFSLAFFLLGNLFVLFSQTETRNVGPFDKLEVNGHYTVTLIAGEMGSHPASCRVATVAPMGPNTLAHLVVGLANLSLMVRHAWAALSRMPGDLCQASNQFLMTSSLQDTAGSLSWP